MRRTSVPAFLLVAIVVGLTSSAFAQGLAEGIDHYCRLGPTSGSQRLRAGRWTEIDLTAVNRTDQPALLEASAFLAGDPQLQFARRLLVPPHTSRIDACPLFAPLSADSSSETAELMLFWNDVSSEPTPAAVYSSPVRADSRYSALYQDPVATGWLTDALAQAIMDEQPLEERNEAPYEALVAAQLVQNRDRRIMLFDQSPLNISPLDLDSLDVLLLSTDRIATELDSLSALREWTLGGGRLWIMLDLVSPDTVSRLLGDAFTCNILDRTPLTQFQIRRSRPGAVANKDDGLRDYDYPVELVRVLPENVSVAQEIDGWPASFWMRFGEGNVLFTTLSARAWVRPAPRLNSQPSASDEPFPGEGAGGDPPAHNFHVVATRELTLLADDLLSPRSRTTIDNPALAELVSQQIGYRIIGRGLVMGVLGAFCVSLAIAGWVLHQRSCLERIAWVGPAAAFVAAAVLLVLGGMSRQRVPPSMAALSCVSADPGVQNIAVTGVVGVFHPDHSRVPVGASGSVVFFPDMNGLEGQVRRMVWTDENIWSWEQLSLPPGLRMASLQASESLADPIRVRATLGPEGLTGTVEPGRLQNPEDALIYVPRQPVLAARISPDRQLSATPDDVLATGQILPDALLSDRQQSRRDVLSALFTQADSTARSAVAYDGTPTLCFWADNLALPIDFPETERSMTSSLIRIPIRLDRCQRGTRVRIPSTLLPYTGLAAFGERLSSAFGNENSEWIAMERAGWSWLRFQLPESVVPLKVEEAELTVEIDAASRTLQIFSPGEEDRLSSVASIDDPAGLVRLRLESPHTIPIDKYGGMILGIEISEQSTSIGGSQVAIPWKIQNVQLELAGVTQ